MWQWLSDWTLRRRIRRALRGGRIFTAPELARLLSARYDRAQAVLDDLVRRGEVVGTRHGYTLSRR